ncbi:uncharacterized protein CXQ87_003433 [Candidozyma duobushaemuli]|uniref:Uncharacterized protein n=2 Tax=Candidozyma TaxID=3303203 RepID=A0ABX8IDH3_9ASCO|nr:uncharacterized protein CXQ87_003433 [[Candida] duobushaemulonis]PVH15587.1 hypothetical protein CXQ87_003433 [[Candida] duobushaemulonis]QWU88781.1 hypothetical protein CA3LBN_003089 [[Candida] haemuloni]
MANEYYAVILEFSARKINIGFAGEAAPSVSIRPDSPIWIRYHPPYKETYPRYFQLQSHSITQEQKEEILLSLKDDNESSKSLNAFQEAHRKGEFAFWEQDGYESLCRLLKHVVTKQLMVTPRYVKIMILDDDSSALDKFQLCSAVLGPLGCATSVFFIPRAPCISMAASVEDSLVVEFGWSECRVSALSELRVVKHTVTEDYSEETISFREAENDDGAENAALKDFAKFGGLPKLLAKLVGDLAVDVRPQVLQNLVFCGDIASIDLQRHLVKESQKEYPKLTVSGKYCLGAWAGASIYCSTSFLKHDMNALRHKEVTLEKLRTGKWKDVFLGS